MYVPEVRKTDIVVTHILSLVGSGRSGLEVTSVDIPISLSGVVCLWGKVSRR